MATTGAGVRACDETSSDEDAASGARQAQALCDTRRSPRSSQKRRYSYARGPAGCIARRANCASRGRGCCVADRPQRNEIQRISAKLSRRAPAFLQLFRAAHALPCSNCASTDARFDWSSRLTSKRPRFESCLIIECPHSLLPPSHIAPRRLSAGGSELSVRQMASKHPGFGSPKTGVGKQKRKVGGTNLGLAAHIRGSARKILDLLRPTSDAHCAGDATGVRRTGLKPGMA